MISDLLEKLRHWIATNATKARPSTSEEYSSASQNVNEIRSILGSIMKSVNQASTAFKSASRAPTPETAAVARSIVDEIENYSAIKSAISMVKPLFSTGGAYESFSARAILHVIHYLERANFTDAQIQKLKELSTFNPTVTSDFPEEINQSGLDNVLKNSIYNLSNGSQKTLKVIREVLQNAVDATDPKQHPELNSRHGYTPEIRLETHMFKEGDNYYIDVIIEDKGVGMNWDVLSKKFFVTFDSGKAKDKDAAGGFGIAKALIQDAPEHGWSVDTNQMHSSRFHKNVFFGTRKDQEYVTPTSEIKKNADGATLSLHGLPWVYSDQVQNLCEVYATNGRVKIFLNDKEQKPRFTMDSDEIKSIDNVSNIPDVISKDESEKEVVDRIFPKFKKEIDDKMEEIGLSSNEKTKYKFFLKKTPTSGKLYVMVNGQYQFDRDKYIPKLDIICSVETTARPGEDDYPLDPGREYLRGDINNRIDELITTIKKFSEKVAEDDLFKDGIESINVNEDATPMTVDEEDSTTSSKEMMLHVLQHVTGAAGFENPLEKAANQSAEPEKDDQDPEGRLKFDKSEQIEKTAEELTKLAGTNSVFSKEAIRNMVADAANTDDRVELNRKIKATIEALTTPGQILIQKNFVARKVIAERSDLVSDTMILWQRAMRLIIQKLAGTTRYSFAKGRTFVPGVVFSDEVLGLYMPAKKDSGRMHDSVSINPVTLAAFVLPKDFQERVAKDSEHEKEAFDMVTEEDSKSSSADTPTNRVAKFIFHLAIHEICHLIYPDNSSSGAENFHKNISKMELVCHDVYEEIKREVKAQMPSLRKSAKKLITLVSKSKTVKEWSAVGFKSWAESKISKSKKVFVENAKEVKFDRRAPKTFKEFLTFDYE